MDEDQRPGLLRRLPERLEAVVAEEHAAHARRDLHAPQHAFVHQGAQLARGQLGLLERQRPERSDAVRVASHDPASASFWMRARVRPSSGSAS